MTIDPLTIPCAYCGNAGVARESITTHGSFDVVLEIVCYTCETQVLPSVWITGGINALVGQLARSGVEIWKSEDGWTWDGDGEAGKAWQTFEYCVLDAWEKMEMREGEK